MPLSVEHSYQPEDHTLIIRFDGEFRGVESHEFEQDILTEIRSSKATGVVCDLAKVTYIDSAAMEFLFKTAKTCKEAGQSFRLANPRDNIRKLFEILRVERIIPIDH